MRLFPLAGATIRIVAVNTKNSFIDPAEYGSVPVYDLMVAAASGHAGIDQRFVHAILDRGVEAVPELLRFALEDHSEAPVNLEEDLIAIFRHLRSPDALNFYIKCIRESPDDVPDELIDAIVPIGQAALEPLVALYEELGEEQGGDVAFLLAALGIRDPRILKILEDRLEYDAGDAALALSVYRDPAARPALQKLLDQIPGDDESLRREITVAMETADEPRPDSEIEPEPFDIWDLFPETSTPPVEVLSEPELLEMLSSPSVEYRAEAALSFRSRSEYSPEVRDRLLQITQSDPEAKVRGAAWEALGEKANEPAVRDSLKKAVANEKLDATERTGALVGLAGATDDKQVALQIRAFYKEPETRAKALEAMWRSFDRQFADIFPKHLDDPDVECRRAAIWGTGYLGTGKQAAKLETMFENEEFRSDALFAYSLIVPAEISHGKIPGLFRKINEVSGGLTYGEAELVQTALDQRLVMHGLDPYFANADPEAEDWDEEEAVEVPPAAPAVAAAAPKAGRNDPCPCGSGKKYKKCHGT